MSRIPLSDQNRSPHTPLYNLSKWVNLAKEEGKKRVGKPKGGPGLPSTLSLMPT